MSQQIVQTPEELIEEWGPQMAEHSMFLYLMLTDPCLKNRALESARSWVEYLCSDEENDSLLRRNLADLKKLKVDVINILKDGKFVGFAWLSFVDHIFRELRYFEDKLNGVVFTPQQELEFWNTIMADHAAFASHLLDPDEKARTLQLIQTAEQTYALPIDGLMTSLVMSLDSGVKMDAANRILYDQIAANQIRSVIPPDLLYHVIREGTIGNNVTRRALGQPILPILEAKPCDYILKYLPNTI